MRSYRSRPGNATITPPAASGASRTQGHFVLDEQGLWPQLPQSVQNPTSSSAQGEPLDPIAPLGGDPQSLIEEVQGVPPSVWTAGYAHYRENITPEDPPHRRNCLLT